MAEIWSLRFEVRNLKSPSRLLLVVMKPASHCLKLPLKAPVEDKEEIWEATLAAAHEISVDAIMNWMEFSL